MSRCGLYEFCESCVNNGHDPFECDTCDEGSNYEGYDPDEELGVHELKFIPLKEAA